MSCHRRCSPWPAETSAPRKSFAISQRLGDGIVGFHAQQAAEKALKAWLTILGIDFPRTHDLSLLIHKLDGGGIHVTSLWELLNLNPFAVQFRYEILDDEPLDHGATLEQVTALLNQVEGLLASKGAPGEPDSDA